MTCGELAEQVQAMQPTALPQDVARLCLLLTNFVEDVDLLVDEELLSEAWRELGIRLQSATDQHAAMTAELEDLEGLHPQSFTTEQVWVLIRAIKVQSQVLQLYVGHPTVEI